jgi:hypothetical protein
MGCNVILKHILKKYFAGILKKDSRSFHVGFEVLRAGVMQNSIFWDLTPYSPFTIKGRFRGICRNCLQSRRISAARIHHESGTEKRFFFDPEDGCYVPSETSVEFKWTTRHYILEDTTFSNVHIHSCNE